MENKALREMSHDEIAQLNPEQFKELATAHNDHLERSEQAYQWPIDVARTLTDKELENRRSSLEIKQMVDEDFKDQGLYAADPFNVSHERTLNAVVDEQVRRYRESSDQTILDKWQSEEFLKGPDNPLNYHDVRADLQWDNRLSERQKDQLANVNTKNEPLNPQQQRDIFMALSKDPGGYNPGPAVSIKRADSLLQSYADREKQIPEPPHPDKEPDALLNERFGKSLLPAVAEAIKELPENVREKMNPFRALLKHQDDHTRELSFPEKLEAEQKAKGQTLNDLAPTRDREQDRERDNDRW